MSSRRAMRQGIVVNGVLALVYGSLALFWQDASPGFRVVAILLGILFLGITIGWLLLLREG